MTQISLNGNWNIDYLSDMPITDTEEPHLSDDKVAFPVPGYFEDHVDILRSTPIHARLKYNPLYTLQRYPQAGYVPDMALPNPVGCFAYERTFTVDSIDNARLYIGGAQNRVSAWINGSYLGTHEGYSSEFYFDIPKDTLTVGKNSITLAVSNNRLSGYMNRPVSGLTSRAANECTGGIYGDVSLRFYSEGLKDAYVLTSKDLSHFTVHTDGAEDFEKTVTIGKNTYTIPKGRTSIDIPTDGYDLWSPDSPVLYKLTVCTQNDVVTRRFGIRKLTACGNRLYLNDKPYFFRGTCEHCYHPITVHPTRDKKYYREVIKKLKSLGFNSMRFHTHIPMPEYIEAADELGFVMEMETPNNTTVEEWRDIITMCRRYTAPVMYSSGNEMTIDEDYVNHLRECAALVHTMTDSLFSPMSAMRAIEYHFKNNEKTVDTPFVHNPERLKVLSEFCDVYNTYSLGFTSYKSDQGDHKTIDCRNSVYDKPLLSHEICIGGTYIDLSLIDRYRFSRIGDTEFMSSVQKHLCDKGLLSRAPTYYKNSIKWQADIRKRCFETLRMSDSFAGYDFLGDIDTHWHTFGYCVGMMNEFYELKDGETVENVRRYNSDTVILADLPRCLNFASRDKVKIPIVVSNYGEDIKKATFTLTLRSENKVYTRKTVYLSDIESGKITELYCLDITLPTVIKPQKLTLYVTLAGGNTDAQNKWELYLFPKAKKKSAPSVTNDIDGILAKLKAGKNVVLFGAGPFVSMPTRYQISVAGRTTGNLATVIADHPVTNDIPHDGCCLSQFRQMLNGGCAVVLDGVPYAPVIEVANSYKNALPLSCMFEYRVLKGRLFVCTLDLKEDDAGAQWLKERILDYVKSDEFDPTYTISAKQLTKLCGKALDDGKNDNEAANKNDITMN